MQEYIHDGNWKTVLDNDRIKGPIIYAKSSRPIFLSNQKYQRGEQANAMPN